MKKIKLMTTYSDMDATIKFPQDQCPFDGSVFYLYEHFTGYALCFAKFSLKKSTEKQFLINLQFSGNFIRSKFIVFFFVENKRNNNINKRLSLHLFPFVKVQTISKKMLDYYRCVKE